MNISLKKKIQHWFNFLKLANQSVDPVVIENLKNSETFYEAWGNYKEASFTNWWTEHRHLFRKVSGLRRMTSQDEVDDSALFLVIPFTYAPTTLAKIVQRIYDEIYDLDYLILYLIPEAKYVRVVLGEAPHSQEAVQNA